MGIRLTPAYINRLCFEKKFKTYLIRQSMAGPKEKDNYHYINYRGRQALREKIGSFEPMTKQLILRSQMSEVITILLEKNDPSDALFLSENGTEINCLRHLNDDIFKQTIPVLINREDELPGDICNMIARQTDDLDTLYLQCKEKHKEVLPYILTVTRCSPDLFATILNMKTTEKEFELVHGTQDVLAQHLMSGKISIVRTPSLVKEEKNEL